MDVKIIKKGGYGDRYGLWHEEGAIVELPDTLAQKLIKYRIAVAFSAPPVKKEPVTTAAFAPPENTSKPRGRPRKV